MRILGRLFLGICCLFPSLLLSQAARYSITDVGQGPKQFSIVYAINAHGDVVGDAEFHAFSWSHGIMSIPASLASAFSTARVINETLK